MSHRDLPLPETSGQAPLPCPQKEILSLSLVSCQSCCFIQSSSFCLNPGFSTWEAPHPRLLTGTLMAWKREPGHLPSCPASLLRHKGNSELQVLDQGGGCNTHKALKDTWCGDCISSCLFLWGISSWLLLHR